jgi:hypothetical protein
MTAKTSRPTDAAIWERAIQFEGELSPTAARALLKVRFSTRDRERMRELSAKARAGSLTSQEQQEADIYERLGCLLDILHSKARRILAKHKTASRPACRV